MDFKLTPAVVRILHAFLATPQTPRYGMQLMKDAKVSSGSLYPALTRLERAGWIVGADEDIDPRTEGRPARRYYTMTGEGARTAHLELAELSEQMRPPAPAPDWTAGTNPQGA
ncbi:PadR family transcriptional regulator [Streptomyces sp. WI04-05B]|uniref:PadR family transcriptional regulator n=1 Tax=Streptomyces TaxID=1883 RepID=UPI0029AD98FF|nr:MULTISPECIES: helix-turn-helix transcriptional regulator [unclassified Streptomyces]MDX2541645.1 helix-turn-helix transcriptional regulator [Streptomyces sp. WI04-05B]MDX2583621.1 helix-turn-helix transcriptional regulator [Streptomyces sp. WI04-05A]